MAGRYISSGWAGRLGHEDQDQIMRAVSIHASMTLAPATAACDQQHTASTEEREGADERGCATESIPWAGRAREGVCVTRVPFAVRDKTASPSQIHHQSGQNTNRAS